MQYDVKIDNAELIVILAALGKQKSTHESLNMFEAAHQVSELLAKFKSVKPNHVSV